MVKKATVTDLRYRFSNLKRELSRGNEVLITRRGKVIGRLVPDRELPDIMARLRKNFGDYVCEVSGAELISQDREGR